MAGGHGWGAPVSKDDYGTRAEWQSAMETALKREGKRLFSSSRNPMGGYYVDLDSRAWCCSIYTPSSNSKGPQKVKAHLRSITHFKEWCLDNKGKALERFPEVKLMFAQAELVRIEKERGGVTSTTSIDIVKIGKALLGRSAP
jgi:hypothetical protein